MLDPQIEDIVDNTFILRRTLLNVLPENVVDYIISLISKDSAHQKFLEITKEDE